MLFQMLPIEEFCQSAEPYQCYIDTHTHTAFYGPNEPENTSVCGQRFASAVVPKVLLAKTLLTVRKGPTVLILADPTLSRSAWVLLDTS